MRENDDVRLAGQHKMPVDNRLYDREGDIWWNDDQPLSMLRAMLNPVRFGFFRDELTKVIPMGLTGLKVLDVGCGGGLLDEEVAQLGLLVTGLDPSQRSLVTARRHAAQSELSINYVAGKGERLPVANASHDIVICCDVLEHVDAPDRVISEIARALKPNGIFFYDTINRTLASKVAVITLFQNWQVTSCAPANLHEWKKFIKPLELQEMMARHGLHNRTLCGMRPGVNPIELIRQMRKRKRGGISYAELGKRMKMRITDDLSISYMGLAVKRGN
ncbi:MAG TPA: bifunctional 2-polyprenyl-6-hydroxyphenol methylase/3-demethylubiquinol 3-O-methyltransferase UbiG [Bryobacteraceae bacterium]|nr:bifunctional 2-polyprenyl-6-hydroxyphenol methylase/3-demethylubiquinol 3-O-methyltransferase UbiG [Bryobacteraceae bacterium]